MVIRLLALLAISGLLHTPAEARSCGLPPPIERDFAISTLVVTGRVVSIGTRIKDWPEPDITGERWQVVMRVATIEVERHWKGTTAPMVQVETCEECVGRLAFEVGERWVVFARGDPPSAGSCGRTFSSADPGYASAMQWLEAQVVLPSGVATPQERRGHPLESLLLAEFRKINPDIGEAVVLELRTPFPGGSQVLLGWGIRSIREFRGDFTDELFGIFIVDSAWRQIERTLEILPTPRWLDYEMRIESLTPREVVVAGKGATYGDGAMRRKYALTIK